MVQSSHMGLLVHRVLKYLTKKMGLIYNHCKYSFACNKLKIFLLNHNFIFLESVIQMITEHNVWRRVPLLQNFQLFQPVLSFQRKPDDQIKFISNYIDVYQRLKMVLKFGNRTLNLQNIWLITLLGYSKNKEIIRI